MSNGGGGESYKYIFLSEENTFSVSSEQVEKEININSYKTKGESNEIVDYNIEKNSDFFNVSKSKNGIIVSINDNNNNVANPEKRTGNVRLTQKESGNIINIPFEQAKPNIEYVFNIINGNSVINDNNTIGNVYEIEFESYKMVGSKRYDQPISVESDDAFYGVVVDGNIIRITINSANDSDSERGGKIIVKGANDLSLEITVNQPKVEMQATYVFENTNNRLNVNAMSEGAGYNIKITSTKTIGEQTNDVGYEFSTDNDFIHLESRSFGIRMNVDANITTSRRTGTWKAVQNESGKEMNGKVSQDQLGGKIKFDFTPPLEEVIISSDGSVISPSNCVKQNDHYYIRWDKRDTILTLADNSTINLGQTEFTRGSYDNISLLKSGDPDYPNEIDPNAIYFKVDNLESGLSGGIRMNPVYPPHIPETSYINVTIQ